jgi:hypothetical protein
MATFTVHQGFVEVVLVNNLANPGGIAQNLSYFNLSMTNIRYEPILIYSYYNQSGFSTPVGVSATTAAAQPVAPVTANTPLWRDILISNLTATVGSLGQAGLIWGRTELHATNISLIKITITALSNFDLYNADAVRFVDSRIALPGGSTFSLYNAQLTVTNRAAPTNSVSFDGLDSASSLALSNVRASMSDADALGANPISLNASILTNSTDLTLPALTAVNFGLGAAQATVTVSGNLTLNGTLNTSGSDGFGAGTYTLFTYSGTFAGNPVLGARPAGYNCVLSTNTPHQISLIVTVPPPPSFNYVAASGSNLVLGGVGGPSNGVYALLTSTNVSVPVYQWLSVATGHFDSAGAFSITNIAGLGSAQRFYLLRVP